MTDLCELHGRSHSPGDVQRWGALRATGLACGNAAVAAGPERKTTLSRILTAGQVELRAKVRAFARDVVGPRRLEAYENPPFLMEMNRLMGKEGIFRTVVPKAKGGAEMGTMGGVIVVEELARECPALAIATMVQCSSP